MKKILAIAMCASLMISIAAIRPSETSVDFSGLWKLDTTQSDFGKTPSAKAAPVQILIQKSATDVTFERSFLDQPVSKETLKLDSSELEIKYPEFSVKRRAKFYEDIQVLTVVSNYQMKPAAEDAWEYNRGEVYTLAKDGKSMLLTRVTVTSKEVDSVKAVYVRAK